MAMSKAKAKANAKSKAMSKAKSIFMVDVIFPINIIKIASKRPLLGFAALFVLIARVFML